MNAFDKLYACQKLQNKEFQVNTPKKLGLQITNICYNICKNCCSSCTPNGEELDLELVLNSFPNIKTVGLTGGEAFLHKNIGNFIEEFAKRGRIYECSLNLMTAGINPHAPKELIKQYYDNLEILCKTEKGLINFSYGEGVEPEKRFEDFLIKKKELDNKYGWTWLQTRVLGKDKEKEAYEIINKILGDEDHRLSIQEIIRKDSKNNIISDKKCDIDNKEITIKANGDLSICCSIPSEIIRLMPYANIYKHSIKEILERRSYYLELLKEFQNNSDRKDNCSACVNKNGFNDFMEELAEKLNQNL